jgi:hypothetical protein
MMNRVQVIQRLVDAIGGRSYLEIGVRRGSSFLPIRAKKKVAVDPALAIPWGRRLRWLLRNPRNVFAEYCAVTSDEYFARSNDRFDVVFVDGLHTHAQSLADVENALERLNAHGVIVVHDCSPTDASSAQALPPPNGDAWFGDVWKTMVTLRSTRSDVRAWVLDCDCGLGIVTRGIAEEKLSLTPDEIDAMTYDDLAADRKNLLGLRPVDTFDAFEAFLARVRV